MTRFKFFLACTVSVLAWLVLAVFGGLEGWWSRAAVGKGDHDAFFQFAKTAIESDHRGSAALVLLSQRRGRVQYFSDGINQDTLFATASASKWITALCVMSLVQQQRVSLDTPVADYLTRWQLPPSAFNHSGVTVRHLLSHMAGLTDGLGFGDYSADETLPTLEETLTQPRASSGDSALITVGQPPGDAFRYSGGGYLILQLLVEEVTGETFADVVAREIFDPAGMQRSTYAGLSWQENASPNYSRDAAIVPTYHYAAAAATGLSSSADDLARLVNTLLDAASSPINTATLEAMRQPHSFVFGAPIWGLGTMLYAKAANGDMVYGHDGANDPAINATVRINPESGDALIVLISGHPTLATRIGSEWVLWQTGRLDFLSTERALRSAAVPSLAGAAVIIALALVRRRRTRSTSLA